MNSRLLIRPWALQSVQALFVALSHPSLYDLIPAPPPVNVDEFVRRHDPGSKRDTLAYSAHLILGSDTPIGLLEVRFNGTSACEIGFFLAREHWGQGFGTEMVGLLLSELARHRSPMIVSAKVDERNAGSIRLLEKCGFTVIGSDETMLKREASVDVVLQTNL